MKKGFYWLVDDIEDPILVYYYCNPDTRQNGFGFNIADGGGFLPEDDLTKKTRVIKAEIKPIQPVSSPDSA